MSVLDFNVQHRFGNTVPDIRVDYDASDNAIYQGWAFPDTPTSAAKWLLCKRTYDSSNRVTYQQVIVNAIWDNRATSF